MNKRAITFGDKLGIVLIIFVYSVILGLSSYFLLGNHLKEKVNVQTEENFPVIADTLDISESVRMFNESFIYYLLNSLDAQQLHNIPLTPETPKIQFNVENEFYFAIVNDGMINVSKGEINEEDILIKTTREESVKMILNESYIKNSFKDGKSSITLVASETVLFSKGYLEILKDFL